MQNLIDLCCDSITSGNFQRWKLYRKQMRVFNEVIFAQMIDEQ